MHRKQAHKWALNRKNPTWTDIFHIGKPGSWGIMLGKQPLASPFNVLFAGRQVRPADDTLFYGPPPNAPTRPAVLASNSTKGNLNLTSRQGSGSGNAKRQHVYETYDDSDYDRWHGHAEYGTISHGMVHAAGGRLLPNDNCFSKGWRTQRQLWSRPGSAEASSFVKTFSSAQSACSNAA